MSTHAQPPPKHTCHVDGESMAELDRRSDICPRCWYERGRRRGYQDMIDAFAKHVPHCPYPSHAADCQCEIDGCSR